MSTFKLKILISGAGIAGPCLAYWLAKTRFQTSITIVERALLPRATSQSIDIHGPAVEIVKKMKVVDSIHSCSTTEEGTQILNSSGKAIALFNAGDAFTAEYEILRTDSSRLFLEATESLSNVQYMYGNSIKSLELTDEISM